MNCGNAVKEVWKWREELDKELRKIPKKKRVNYLHEKAVNFCKEYGIPYNADKKKKLQTV